MTDRLAPALIREIRRRSGLSQAELARRAGMTRSVMNAYEHGRRQPSVAAIGRIAGAAGLKLELAPGRPLPDDERAARILSQVLDLAEALPTRRRGALRHPPFARRVR